MSRRTHTMVGWGSVLIFTFVIALFLDQFYYRLLHHPAMAGEDWVQLLRQLGYLPTWIGVAVLFCLLDARRGSIGRRTADGLAAGAVSVPRAPYPWHHRGGLVLLSVLLGGLAANVLKPLIGRLRPDPMDTGRALMADRPWVLWADGGDLGLGLPSGHTTVAFAGCGMLALLVPAWRRPMMLLAAGCALTRLFAGAHTLSDTVAGAWVGLAVAAWLWAWGEGPRRGPANGLLPHEA